MANELDETAGPVNTAGRDVFVIEKQLPVEIGFGTRIFELSIWIVGVLAALGIALASAADPVVVALSVLLGVVPGLVFQYMKTMALSYLRKLQQKVQADASQIDNYLEQRVVILENLADLVSKSIDLDKDVMKSVAALRSGSAIGQDRNRVSAEIDGAFARINVAFEAYPDLRAQSSISEAMRQNAYTQKEITAARTLYNDTVTRWNQDIFAWPTKQIVAAKQGYTTRIPFTASETVKVAARDRFFDA